MSKGLLFTVIIIVLILAAGAMYLFRDLDSTQQNRQNIETEQEDVNFPGTYNAGQGLDYGQTDLNSQGLRKNVPKENPYK